MRGLVRDLGGDHTVLISSHILPEVEETCDQLLVLREGELVVKGTEAELLERAGGKFDFEIEVRGTFEAANSALEETPGVTSSTHVDSRDDLHTFRLRLDGDEGDGVALAIVGAGLGLRRLTDASGELEEAFLSVIGSGGTA